MKLKVRRSIGVNEDYKNIPWEEEYFVAQPDILGAWPDLHACIRLLYEVRFMGKHPASGRPPIRFEYSKGFMKDLEKLCLTDGAKLRVLDALVKKIYCMPNTCLKDCPIKEKPGVWHFYISTSLRVFYRIHKDLIVFERFCRHPKTHA
jgi:mRNA-degrading endonuclease YafQ of YafQ-DinJ toxin-antitoxin module